ncbi:MAG TPA: hypothetical protein ENI99_03715 [Sedimenticola sp.]|nr:hypothetical protein [Sedimenticola sp.]
MEFLKTKAGLAVAAGAIILILVISVVSCTSTRFQRISVCTVCHEIFVDYDEYKPMGEVSTDIEDYKPRQLFEPEAFDATVGCAECHAYPYEEYRESPHYDNELGVRPGCVGCHEPHSVAQILRWKFFYVNKGGLGESPFHAISNSLRNIPKWEELRIELAKKVRKKFIETQSAKCQVCHKTESEWWNEIKRHQTMKEKGKSCIHCHYNLVHAEVDWEEDEE